MRLLAHVFQIQARCSPGMGARKPTAASPLSSTLLGEEVEAAFTLVVAPLFDPRLWWILQWVKNTWRYTGVVMFSPGLARISLLYHMDLPCRSPKWCPLGAASPKLSTPRKDHTCLERAGGSDTILPTNELCSFHQRAKVISWEQMFASPLSKTPVRVCYDFRE